MLLARLPAPGEFFNLRIKPIGQNDPERDVIIAVTAVTASDALALETAFAENERRRGNGTLAVE